MRMYDGIHFPQIVHEGRLKRHNRRGKRVLSKKNSLLLALLILSVLITGIPPLGSGSSPTPSSAQIPFQPSNATGSGTNIEMIESVNGFKAHGLNAKNCFSGPNYLVKTLNDSFGIQVPTNFATAWQNITFSNIVATPEYMSVQDGFGTSYLKCGSQGLLNRQFVMLAINFRVPFKVNLTSVWLRYAVVQGSDYPPPIPLSVVTDSPSQVPSGTVLGSGILQNSIGPGWNEVQIQTSGGAPVTLEPRTTYWLVMNGSSIPRLNTGYYQWYYVSDNGGSYDGRRVAAMPAKSWLLENSLFQPINLLSVLFVRAVDDSLKMKVYSSAAEVGMALNDTEVSGNTVRVDASKTFFQFTTNCSVTFTANWTARFEHPRPTAVSTNFVAKNGLTLWNASFSVEDKPSNPYTWFNLTFRVSPLQVCWSTTSPPTNVSNARGYPSVFSVGSDCYLLTQTNDVNGSQSWTNDWVINTRSSFWIRATTSSQVLIGMPLTVSISTIPLSCSPSHCNVTFYDQTTGHPVYSGIHAIESSPYQFQVRLNQSARYVLYLFDTWDSGNEVSLNNTLIVTTLAPLCNLTVISNSRALLDSSSYYYSSLNFKFFNNCLGTGDTWMQPDAVYLNGTLVSNPSYNPLDGVTTLYLNTTSGGWHAGYNYLNITAVNGIFSNFIVYPYWIPYLDAVLSLNATKYGATYGDGIPVGFSLLDTPANKLQSLPSEPTLYMNGTEMSFTTLEDGTYVCVLNTRDLPGAGTYYLNFTAEFGPYIATNVTIVDVSKIQVNLTMALEQNTVSPESPLSVSVTLVYPNGTAVEDGTEVAFNLTVTYANSTTEVFDELNYTLGGVAIFLFQTTADMISVAVQAFYAGSPTQASASTEIQQATVLPV